MNAPEPQHGVQGIQELLGDLIPHLGFDAAREVQVLYPMTRGGVRTRNLDAVLQELLIPPRPDKAELTRDGMKLRVGDGRTANRRRHRLIQQVNDYNREVFNSDLGAISAIDTEEQEVTVQFEERIVTYDYADTNELALAFAVAIHKAQGAEYTVVILPMFMQHYLMLSRNLLYIGLTRAKQLAILVCPAKAIGLAVRQVKDRERYTLLSQRLMSATTSG